MIRYFCSSDIHSFFDIWMMSLTAKGFDINNPEHKIIVCGDVFDRGDKSVECYEFMTSMIDEGRLIYIRGNHEDLLFNCIQDLRRGRHIGHHHVSNGTIKTLAHFMNCSEYDILCNCYNTSEFEAVVQELMQFIENNSVDYFELGDKVFVHGWIPTTVDDENYEVVDDNWRDGDWKQARWNCGFDCWRCNLVPPDDKTVVCGHWHASYGWSQFRGRSEWGPDAEFVPFIDNKIIAIDACTPYTNMINVVVFDEEGNILE